MVKVVDRVVLTIFTKTVDNFSVPKASHRKVAYVVDHKTRS